MNYHEALQNPHFKKIWGKVMMNRHLEAKGLEEALEVESKEDQCYILQFANSNPQMHAVLNEMKGSYPFYEKFQILGRQITLDDILALQDNLFFGENAILCGSYFADCKFELDRITDWKLAKPLHEQNPETWEKIAQLISE